MKMLQTLPATIPDPLRDHLIGEPGSKLTLLEYGDYECPYCGKAHKEVKRLLNEVGDEILFSFRNFPLTRIHPHAHAAAVAAEAAGQQERFWEMHDTILENQRLGLTGERLLEFAVSLGLDIEKFVADVSAPELTERVKQDILVGFRGGVNATPTFFINGTRHDGPFDFDSLLDALARLRP